MENTPYPEDVDLQKYWLVLQRRWPIVLGVVAGSVGLAGTLSQMKQPLSQVQGRLLFQSDRTGSLTGVGEKIGSLESLKREASPLDTQAVVMQSTPVLAQVIQNLKLTHDDGKRLAPEDLRIKVEPMVGTDVLKISSEGRDGKQAAAIVNEIMRVYMQRNVQNNRAQAVTAGDFLAKQLPSAKAELETAAAALQQYRSRHSIIELDKETTVAVTTLGNLGDQVNQARAQMADVSTQEATLNRQVNLSPDRVVKVTALSQNIGIQTALADLQKVQTQLAILKGRYRAEHPEVAVLSRQEAQLNQLLQAKVQEVGRGETLNDNLNDRSDLQIGALRQKLAGDFLQLRSTRLGLEQKIKTLIQVQNSYRARAERFPQLTRDQSTLEQRYALARKSYENLFTRLQDVRIAENQTLGNARIIQQAMAPQRAPANNRSLYLMGGGVIGVMLGVAAAFAIDLLDRSLKSLKETQLVYGYSLLGLIPKFKTLELPEFSLQRLSPRIIVATGPRSQLHDAYRMLSANLKFTSFDKKVRTIVITSAIRGEGKSEVAANLAATLAQSGKRTLLIDGDLRTPAQHHLWGVLNTTGLSNVVVDPSEYPHALNAITDKLSVLTAGVMPPDPLALLDSESMANLLAKCARDFDYVIIDSSPLVGTADAAVLGKLADGVLMVTRPGVVQSPTAKAAKALLERSGSNVLGLVANGVDTKHEPDSFYYDQSAPVLEPAPTRKVLTH